METTRITESASLTSDHKVDREAGIIRGVRVIGSVSRNGRRYSDRALNDGVKLYEEAHVNIDHRVDAKGSPNRSVVEGFGVLRDCKRDADGVRADLHYLKSHPLTEMVLERAERFSSKFGLSHDAEGTVVRHGNESVVESLERVHSVDVVLNPATNKSLFESERRTVKTTIRSIIEEQFPKTSKTCGLLEMDGGALAQTAVETGENPSSDDQVWSAFKAAIDSAIDDDKLDIKATLKKVGEILKAYEKLTGGGGSSASGDSTSGADGGAGMMSESTKTVTDPNMTKLLERLERFEKRDTVKTLMEAHGLTGDAGLFDTLMKLPDEASMKALCEREKSLRPGHGKRKPLMEAANESVAFPSDTKSFVSSLKS